MSILEDVKPSTDDRYFDVFDELVFRTPTMNTQDMHLLTSAILNRADYFVTTDISLIGKYGKFIRKRYNLKIVQPSEMKRVIMRM